MPNAGGTGVARVLLNIWRRVRWPLGIVVAIFVALIIYRIPAVIEQERTAETVDRIYAQRLTPEHVDGKHLPPPPDPAQADATIEGVDANQNGIRDDVELAIFEKYPNSPYTRAAELQYAMALQMYLTRVFNSETWVAAVQQTGRGYGCVFETGPKVTLSDGDKKIQESLRVIRVRQNEVEKLVLNTDLRETAHDEINRKYTTSYGSDSTVDCDVAVQ